MKTGVSLSKNRKKSIDVSFSCVRPVTDHEFRHVMLADWAKDWRRRAQYKYPNMVKLEQNPGYSACTPASSDVRPVAKSAKVGVPVQTTAAVLLLVMNFVITFSKQLWMPSRSADYNCCDNVMTNFIISNMTEAWKTDFNFFQIGNANRLWITCTIMTQFTISFMTTRGLWERDCTFYREVVTFSTSMRLFYRYFAKILFSQEPGHVVVVSFSASSQFCCDLSSVKKLHQMGCLYDFIATNLTGNRISPSLRHNYLKGTFPRGNH